MAGRFWHFVKVAVRRLIPARAFVRLVAKIDNNPYWDVFLFGMKFRTIHV